MMLPIHKARQTEERIVGLQAYFVSENKNLSLHLAFMYALAFSQVFALQVGFYFGMWSNTAWLSTLHSRGVA